VPRRRERPSMVPDNPRRHGAVRRGLHRCPKHPPPIIERTVGGFLQIDSGWARLLGDTESFGAFDWRSHVNSNPAKPVFVILLRSSKPGRWAEALPETALVCDGRRIGIGCRRADVFKGETARASFLVCDATMEDLAALSGATDAALVIDGRRCSFGASGPETFREVKRRSER